MKNLTAERCREKIEMWERLERNNSLATTSEDHLQAYRIALPILEQQERGEGEWIEWSGDECPVDGGVMVETRWSDGDIISNRARAFGWHQSQHAVNIIAYRIIPEQRTEEDGGAK